MVRGQTADAEAGMGQPVPFTAHPNLGSEINQNILRSELDGGVFLDDLQPGATLEVQTKNRLYLLQNCDQGQMLISGHPEHCPEPVLVKVYGSTWGHSMLKLRYIGRGMRLEYRHPTRGLIRTSRILDVRERPEHQLFSQASAA
jgi:hypothetical protein